MLRISRSNQSAAATYYVSASNANCTSATRTAAAVTVGTPTKPTPDNNNVNTSAGQKVTFTVTSPTTGIIYHLFTTGTMFQQAARCCSPVRHSPPVV